MIKTTYKTLQKQLSIQSLTILGIQMKLTSDRIANIIRQSMMCVNAIRLSLLCIVTVTNTKDKLAKPAVSLNLLFHLLYR